MIKINKQFHLAIVLVTLTSLVMFSCRKKDVLPETGKDNTSVFESAWSTIDKKYALFSEKEVDWQAIYSQYKTRVNNDMSSNDLFKTLSQMLESLKDGHVVLMSGFDTSGYTGFYELYPLNFNYDNVKRNYLQNTFSTLGPFDYKIKNSIGYIRCQSFSQSISESQTAQIITAMKDTKGIIIDVRSNTGGVLNNAETLCRTFLPQRMLVRYEQYKNGDGHNNFAAPVAFYLQPSFQTYLKNIVVLTNRSCFSSCNDFVSYMNQLPNVTLVGDQTGGGGSIPARETLPNGWVLQYSSTKTLSPQKTSIENGILPDYPVSITPIDEANGKDPILEKAFSLLQ